MTDEGASSTEKFVENNAMKYAYGYDKKGELARFFGVRGIPNAVLLDPNGVVLWQGHPGMLDERTIEGALEGALEVPLWEWPKEADKARKALASGKYAAALEAATGVEGDYADMIRARVTSKRDFVKKAKESGDYLAAFRVGEPSAKELKGLPEGDEIAQMLEEIESNPESKDILKAQEKLAKMIENANDESSNKKIQKAMEDIAEFGGKYPGTIVEEQASAAVKTLRSRL